MKKPDIPRDKCLRLTKNLTGIALNCSMDLKLLEDILTERRNVNYISDNIYKLYFHLKLNVKNFHGELERFSDEINNLKGEKT